MAANLPKVSLVSPVHNGGSHYGVCLEALTKLEYPTGQLEVIIVDDGSTDGTRERLQEQTLPDHFTCLFPPQNLGRSAARNLGLAGATGEVVILLDGDMEVAADFVQAHIAELARPGRQAVLGKVVRAPWVRRNRLQRYLYEYPQRGARQFAPEQPITFQYLLTHNLALTRQALEAGGPFDEAFVHYGGEDTLFAYRVARAYPNGLYYAAAPLARHHHQRTLKQHLADARNYGYHNLPRIVERHPEISVPLAADYAWPLPGPFFRRKRALGTLLFNGLSYGIMRALAPLLPPPISSTAIRYLTVAAVVRGLRRYVRQHQVGSMISPVSRGARGSL